MPSAALAQISFAGASSGEPQRARKSSSGNCSERTCVACISEGATGCAQSRGYFSTKILDGPAIRRLEEDCSGKSTGTVSSEVDISVCQDLNVCDEMKATTTLHAASPPCGRDCHHHHCRLEYVWGNLRLNPSLPGEGRPVLSSRDSEVPRCLQVARA